MSKERLSALLSTERSIRDELQNSAFGSGLGNAQSQSEQSSSDVDTTISSPDNMKQTRCLLV